MAIYSGKSGDDNISASEGADSISGLQGDDTLYGGKGNDTLNGGPGNDAINGGNDTDVAVFSGRYADYTITYDAATGSYTVADKIAGRDGVDTLTSVELLQFSDGSRSLAPPPQPPEEPGPGNDTVSGGGNADLLDGLGGNDTLYGGKGNDTLIAGPGDDVLNGQTEYDTAVFSGNWADYVITRDESAGTYTLADQVAGRDGVDVVMYVEWFVFADGGRAPSQLISVSTVTSPGNDSIGGTSGPDAISGAEGNDTLYGGKGDDTLNGGSGDDLLDGGPDSDTAVFNGNAADYLVSLSGDTYMLADTLPGRDGSDLVVNVEFFAFADGTLSAAQLPLQSGVLGTTYDDTLTGTDAADSVVGLGGNDLLRGGDGNDTLRGGSGNDALIGDGGNDLLDGGAGQDDALYFYSTVAIDADLARGSVFGEGTDLLQSIEVIAGSQYDDTIAGSAAGEDLQGNDGNDRLVGRGGDDSLHGGTGRDTLEGGSGNDYLDGSDGAQDVAVFSGVISDYTITRTAGVLTVTDNVAGRDGSDRLTYITYLTFADGTFDIEAALAPRVPGTPGDDILRGSLNPDTLIGLSGNDMLLGNGGSDLLDGGDGQDVLDGGAGDDMLVGGAGDDTLRGGSGNDTLDGGDGTDTADYGSLQFTLVADLAAGAAQSAEGGSDVLAGIENLIGGLGSDRLTGDAQANVLQGDQGDDVLDGGAGADQLYGGKGDDTYLVDNAGDTVHEGLGGGIDTVVASVDYVLGGEIEKLVLGLDTPVRTGVGNGKDNLIAGNALDNFLDGAAGADMLLGGNRNDSLAGGAGDDTLDGGAGIDTAIFAGPRSNYTVTATDTGYVVVDLTGDGGTDTLTGVERLAFSDGKLALDLDGHAGEVARLLGAVLGSAGAADAAWAERGLALLDGGMSEDDLARFALHAVLGEHPSDAAVVDLLYTNVVGYAPGTEARALFVGLLQQGVYTQSTLALMAADHALNLEHIHLSGLAASGLAY